MSQRTRFPRPAFLAGALALPLILAACMPPMPPPPPEGHVVQPFLQSVSLAGDTFNPTLSPSELDALRALLARGREAGARRLRVDVSGSLAEARKNALASAIKAEAPGAEVVFSPGGQAVTITLRGVVAVAKRCLSPDPWLSAGRVAPGCAVDTVLGRMVEDPRDLLIGRPAPPGNLEPLANDSLDYLEGKDRTKSSETKPRGKMTSDKGTADDATAQ